MEALELLKEIKNDLQELKRALAKSKSFPPANEGPVVPIAIGRAGPLKEEWLRTDQVLRALKIASRTLYRMKHDKILPTTKIKGIIYIKASDVEQLLNKNYKPEPTLIPIPREKLKNTTKTPGHQDTQSVVIQDGFPGET